MPKWRPIRTELSAPHMFLLRLLFKNAFRHRLRTVLTMVGLVVAILSLIHI